MQDSRRARKLQWFLVFNTAFYKGMSEITFQKIKVCSKPACLEPKTRLFRTQNLAVEPKTLLCGTEKSAV